MNKTIDKIFVITFFIIILIPIINFKFGNNIVSKSEKRMLNNFPSIKLLEEKKYNDYIIGIENWLNDRIGFRDVMISNKAYIDFKVFDKINSSSFYLSKNKNLLYSSNYDIKDYAGNIILSKEKIKDYVNSYNQLNSYIEERNIQFYYIPCYDKQYIYFNDYLKDINTYALNPKKQQIIDALKKYSNIKIIDIKDKLIEASKKYLVYGEWSDPTHWTNRGAYIAYLEIIKNLQKYNSSVNIKALTEDNYDLSIEEKCYYLNNNCYNKDKLEKFTILSPNAKLKDTEILGKYQDAKKHLIYENKSVDNNLNLLIIGDSYSRFYILDDLAESFSSVTMVYNSNLDKEMLDYLIDNIKPNIIILEESQRMRIENIILNMKLNKK